ncbi:efflux RND transporter periplasmic adaptor subunit [Schlesneria sp. T3-172]|uniref:efflux RND transporter periplasmic adaptor subunit n=1 Tax=Schlesneria sphaerica TaxID=3373610 RepID=UPI0037CB4A83
MKSFVTGMGLGATLVAVALGVGISLHYVQFSAGQSHKANPHSPSGSPLPTSEETPLVTRTGADELHVPAEIANKMGMDTAVVADAASPIALPSFQGVLALDNDHLSRVHARFGGEVVEIGKSTDGSDPTLRVGERVRKGDLLAVVWSTDLGQKKSDLVDSMTKLRAEEELRDRLKKLFDTGAGAGRNYRDAEKDVQIRLVEIASLERTLRTWRVTDDDFAEIRAETNRVAKADELHETTMPVSEAREWARVEVRAPISGVILEKNAVVGDIVGTDTDLFKIGDISHLAVWVHVYEEDLPILEKLPRPIQWTVELPSQPGKAFAGTLEKVGAVIDPTQHTALATGRVENTDGKLKIGQFVTVKIQMPAPEHELELPSTSVVESGRDSFVFVRQGNNDELYARKPVRVVRRFRDRVYIDRDEKGIQDGDIVITSGALMLQNVMDQLPNPAEMPSQGLVIAAPGTVPDRKLQ